MKTTPALIGAAGLAYAYSQRKTHSDGGFNPVPFIAAFGGAAALGYGLGGKLWAIAAPAILYFGWPYIVSAVNPATVPPNSAPATVIPAA